MACWAMGRLLGPQLMVAGGGHPTHQWFGMYYAGQAGRRLPVPIFQALEDFAVYLDPHRDRTAARPLARRHAPHSATRPGSCIGTAMVLWGIERSLDEHLWLGEDGRLGSDLVQLAGVLLVVSGAVILWRTRTRWREWLRTHHAGDELEAMPADHELGTAAPVDPLIHDALGDARGSPSADLRRRQFLVAIPRASARTGHSGRGCDRLGARSPVRRRP